MNTQSGYMTKRTTVLAGVFASLFMVAATAHADARGCSNASLRGGYGFHGMATIVPAGTPRGLLGVFTFNGNGYWSATLTLNDNGTVRRVTDSGSYSVNADCTGTLSPVAGGTIEIVVADRGREFYQMRTDPSSIVMWGVTKRLFGRGEEYERR